ncbi:MAG: hypothetical protein FWF05_09470 [Oscillospiraceae bacterium]|nr:hypothetical protein [Oscillospiraceae bacterium]
MSDLIIVTLISLAGTAIGTFGGIMTSSRLTNYRIEQLRKRYCERVCPKDTQQFTNVNEYERSSYSNSRKHNNLDSRIVTLEAEIKFLRGGEDK